MLRNYRIFELLDVVIYFKLSESLTATNNLCFIYFIQSLCTCILDKTNLFIYFFQYIIKEIIMFDQRVVALGFLLCFAIVFNFSLHRIEEGHVGVYFRVSNLM